MIIPFLNDKIKVNGLLKLLSKTGWIFFIKCSEFIAFTVYCNVYSSIVFTEIPVTIRVLWILVIYKILLTLVDFY